MLRMKEAEGGGSLDQLEMAEEEKRNAKIGVITNVAIFGAIILALRVGPYVWRFVGDKLKLN